MKIKMEGTRSLRNVLGRFDWSRIEMELTNPEITFYDKSPKNGNRRVVLIIQADIDRTP